MDIIRDRSRSVANLYYTPIDSQGSDNEDDTDPRDPNLDDESHLYSEIKDAPWVFSYGKVEITRVVKGDHDSCFQLFSDSHDHLGGDHPH